MARPANADSGGSVRVDPQAIPSLRGVFDHALSKLDKQVELAVTDIRIEPWAGDPVSEHTADLFNQTSTDQQDSALQALLDYQRQLKSASDALEQVAASYDQVEQDNAANVGEQSGC